jgi:multidrug efflux pump subunit AcrB
MDIEVNVKNTFVRLLILSSFLNITWEAKPALPVIVGVLLSKAMTSYFFYGTATALTVFACKKWNDWNISRQLQKAEQHRDRLHQQTISNVEEVKTSVGDLAQRVTETRNTLAEGQTTLHTAVSTVGAQVNMVSDEIGAARAQLDRVQNEVQLVHHLSGATFRSVDDLDVRIRAQGMLLINGQQELFKEQHQQRRIAMDTSEGVSRLQMQINRGTAVSTEVVQAVARAVVRELRRASTPELSSSRSVHSFPSVRRFDACNAVSLLDSQGWQSVYSELDFV